MKEDQGLHVLRRGGQGRRLDMRLDNTCLCKTLRSLKSVGKLGRGWNMRQHKRGTSTDPGFREGKQWEVPGRSLCGNTVYRMDSGMQEGKGS